MNEEALPHWGLLRPGGVKDKSLMMTVGHLNIYEQIYCIVVYSLRVKAVMNLRVPSNAGNFFTL